MNCHGATSGALPQPREAQGKRLFWEDSFGETFILGIFFWENVYFGKLKLQPGVSQTDSRHKPDSTKSSRTSLDKQIPLPVNPSGPALTVQRPARSQGEQGIPVPTRMHRKNLSAEKSSLQSREK